MARALRITGVALAALVVAFGFALSAGFARDALRAALERAASSGLGVPVRIATLEGPLFPHLAVTGLEVGPPEAPVATASRVALSVDPAALLGAGWSIARVRLEDPLIAVEQTDAGHWRVALPAAGDAGAPAEPLPGIRIGELRATGGALELRFADGRRERVSLDLKAGDLAVPLTPGGVARARAELVLGFRAASPAAFPLRAADLRATLADGRVSLSGEIFGEPGGSAVLEGELAAADWMEAGREAGARFDARVDALDVAAWSGRPRLTGSLDGTVRIDARRAAGAALDAVELDADVSLTGGADAAVRSVAFAAALRDGRWTLSRATLSGSGVALDASGAGDRAHIERLEVSARVDDLTAFSAVADAGAAGDLAGRLALEVSLSGAFERLAGRASLRAEALSVRGVALGDVRASGRGEGDGRLRIDELSLSGGALPLRLGAPVDLVVADGAVAFEGLELDSDALRLSASGALGADAARDLRVDVHGLDVGALAALAGVAEPLRGSLDADLRVDGAFAQPAVDGQIDWKGFEARGLAFERLHATLATEGDRLRVDVVLRDAGRDAVRAAGTAPLAALAAGEVWSSPGAQLSLRADGLDLERWAPLAPDALDGLSGVAAASLELTGGAVPSVRGTLELARGSVRVPGREAPLSPVRGRLRIEPQAHGVRIAELALDVADVRVAGGGSIGWSQAGALALEAALVASRGGRDLARVELAGPVAFADPLGSWLAAPGARLELRADGLDVAWLRPLLPRRVRDVDGRVDGSLRVRGGRPPTLRGELALSEGRVRVALLRQTWEPVRGRVTFDGEHLTLEDWAIGPPEAGATLHGRIDVADGSIGEVSVDVALADLPLSRSAALRADAAGSFHVTGPASALRVRGEIELRDVRAQLGDRADTTLREIRILASDGGASALAERAPGPPGAYGRAAIDLRLSVPRNSWLRGRGAELDLTGDLALRKEPLQPAAVVGRAQVVRGTYRFQGKRFDVRRGTATFDGGVGIDPLLDVEAAHPVRDATILVFVSGRASSPELRIGSEPAMSESDALAYLFLGRPADQLGAGQREGLNDAAAALASGVAAAQVGDLIARALPVDTLDVGIDETGRPSDVSVGKYVTDRLFVRYGRNLGPQPEDEVRLEMRIDDHWSVGADASTDDSAGADVIWSLDY